MSQEFVFWRKLETFIGRDEVLQNLLEMLGDGKFHILSVSGEYGLGKTRLLEELLKRAKKQPKGIALPKMVIDLYQTEQHSPEGLADALVKSFLPTYDFYFTDYYDYKKARDDSAIAGNTIKSTENNQKMLDACATGLLSLSKREGILVLLDTAERWVYPSLDGSPFTENTAPAWEWLKKTCTKLSNGIVLLAGRPEIEKLGFIEKDIFLKEFSVRETKEYLRRTVHMYNNETKGSKIDVTESEIKILHRLSQGRPILLALFLERLMHNDQCIRQAALEAIPSDFEAVVIKNLMDDPRIGILLRVAGRALKGIDLELIALMSGLPEYVLQEDFESLKELSFAKTFPDNNRLFLHDEMYEMLQRNIYDKEGDEIESDQAAHGLYTYHRRHTVNLNKEIGELYIALAQIEDLEGKKDLQKNIQVKTQVLQSLNADYAFYRWQRAVKKDKATHEIEDSVDMGLRRYYRIAHEAATNNEFETLVLLRLELIRFIKLLTEKQQKGQFQPWLPFLHGFLLIQQVWEWNAGGQSAKIINRENEHLLQDLNIILGITPEQKTVLESLILVWRGIASMYSTTTNYSIPQKLFDKSIKKLQSFEALHLRWFQQTVLALAYRQRAYLYKRQGLFDNAINDLKRAATANRLLDFYYEEAMIRNDLGDTQVLTGAFDDADFNLEYAFTLRANMKNGARLASSYSTRARYFTARDRFDDALKNASFGKNLSGVIGRSTAFARVAFAEAARRYAVEIVIPDQRRKELLEVSEKDLLDALSSFIEPALSLDALVELGCLYRDRMRILQSEEYFIKSNEKLLEAKELASQQTPPIYWRIADAMSNRIWLGLFAQELGLFAKDKKFAMQAVKEFENLDIFGFDVTKTGAFAKHARVMKNSNKKTLLQFIGKYHIALGYLNLGVDEKLESEKVEQVALHWMLGLEYSILFAPSFRGLKTACDTIFEKIKKFNQEELQLVSKAVKYSKQSENIRNCHLEKLLKKNAFWFDLKR